MKRRTVFVALAVIAILTVTLGVAQANLKLTAVLNAWDDATNRWENGNLSLYLDNQPEPFYQVLDFDTDLHANACGAGTSSPFAGDAQIGLYHVDNNPPGGQGWQSTTGWSLVKCSTFATNKFVPAADVLATCDPATAACQLIGAPDQVVPCTTGNCTNEIDTTFNLNMDLNCDGTIDPEFNPPGGVCLYWTAQKPPATPPFWNGNFQARVSILGAGGFTGDKTINFKIFGPNAVNVARFAATPGAGPLAAAAVGAVILIGALVVVLPRRRR